MSRSELFAFIESEFNLKTSSVESMMPFLKADGLIEEVGKYIYIATPAAKAWCNSGCDLDFIRILHCHRRFVGEIILVAEKEVTRNQIYIEALKYGLNPEKTKWNIRFLLEAGLLEETQYLHIKATSLGIKFANELPLMPKDTDLQETKLVINTFKQEQEVMDSLSARDLYFILRGTRVCLKNKYCTKHMFCVPFS